jgi:hypothetical protein
LEEEQAFKEANLDFTQRSAELAVKEDQESKSLRSEISEKEKHFVATGESALSSVIDAAIGASTQSKKSMDDEINNVREQYERDILKLQETLADEANREKANLRKRLAARKNKALNDLKRSGKSDSEAAKMIADEDAQAMEALGVQLDEKAATAVAAKKREAAEVERDLVEKEHEMSLLAAANAEQMKGAAMEAMKRIQSEHEREMKNLEDALLNSRKVKEQKLKARLAEKREAKLKDIVDDKQRQIESDKLQQSELQEILEFKRKTLEKEAALKEKQRMEHEARETDVLARLKEAEVEAAKAAAKEAAMRALKELQAQAEHSANIQDLQRLRDLQTVEEEKLKAEQEHQQKHSKDKLGERLQAKREKRERELKEQEEKALAELQLKQKLEAELFEKNRLAKMQWTERVVEIMEKARTLGLADAERENYCFQETLGKNLVPDKQLTEAIQMILKERHGKEMTGLLSANFDERIHALKQAVEGLIKEKSEAKVKLIESLTTDGKDNETIQKEVFKLDEQYSGKQFEVEKRATGQLEDKHLQNQMNLRQQQLQEMATILALYTDSDSLNRLQNSTGKTQEEELHAYKEKIEAEKRQREGELLRERNETEQQMRLKLQEDLQKIQSNMEEEQKRAEVEIDRKKRELARQREEMEKKSQNEMGEIDKAEKERILQTFEKERVAALDALEQVRKSQKAKLNERLNRRKSTLAAVTPPFTQPPEMLTAAAAAESSTAVQSVQNLNNKLAALTNPKTVSDISASVNAETSAAFVQSVRLIEAKLERIEKVILTLEKNGVKAILPPPQEPTVAAPAAVEIPKPVEVEAVPPTPIVPTPALYHDKDDPAPGDSVEFIPEAELPMQDTARLEFGKKLAVMLGLKTLTFRAAASLPPSTASNNAFANSYLYNPVDQSLVVHSNRLHSSGDFGLIVVHALSHIKVCYALLCCSILCSAMLALLSKPIYTLITFPPSLPPSLPPSFSSQLDQSE